ALCGGADSVRATYPPRDRDEDLIESSGVADRKGAGGWAKQPPAIEDERGISGVYQTEAGEIERSASELGLPAGRDIARDPKRPTAPVGARKQGHPHRMPAFHCEHATPVDLRGQLLEGASGAPRLHRAIE